MSVVVDVYVCVLSLRPDCEPYVLYVLHGVTLSPHSHTIQRFPSSSRPVSSDSRSERAYWSSICVSAVCVVVLLVLFVLLVMLVCCVLTLLLLCCATVVLAYKENFKQDVPSPLSMFLLLLSLTLCIVCIVLLSSSSLLPYRLTVAARTHLLLLSLRFPCLPVLACSWYPLSTGQ